MDANESALNQHIKDIEESDKAQDWKDDYIEELTRDGGEYYAFHPDNFQEAIVQSELVKTLLFASYAHVASKYPSETSNRNFAEYAIKIAREYWKSAAIKKADADYDTFTKEL